MDGNKDESERCISLGLRCASDGDFEKALKYLNKAERLYPSQKAKDFIERLEAERMRRRGSRGSEDASESKQESNGHVPRRDKSPSREDHRRKSSGFAKFREKMDTGASSSSNTKVSCEYTQEQVESVRKIKKCKDYYEILSLTKEATDGELKKQYRKLALQFHPDKNKAPGAADAFKAIGNAFAVLSDPQKRRQYDLYGSEEHQRSQRQASSSYYSSDGDGYYYDYSRGFEGDISAEEIFNMFFGGGFPSGNVYVRRQHRYREAHSRGNDSQNQNEPSGYNVLLQMMPVLVLLCLSLMSSFFVADPAYSLIRTQRHPYERKTANLKVPYFVKENFQKDYRGSIAKIESNVEEEFISNLKDACYRERSYKHILLARARSFGDAHLEEKAKSMKTPSCVQLEELSQQHSFW